MNLVRLKEQFLTNVKTYGFSDTIYDLSYRGVNHCTLLMTLKCVTINTADPKYLQTRNGYRCEFLDPDKLWDLSKNPDYQLDRIFLEDAFRKGDECFAIMDGDILASYGWYSNKPTRISEQLELHFNNQYVYMYNGFTHLNYRGQRLHAIGMTMALNHYLQNKSKGIVSWIEGNNFSSLRSCYRMGYTDFGDIYILKLFRKYLILSSNGCRKYGFKVSAIG